MAQKMNMVIAQSGGPSMVINQSLVGAVLEARKSAKIGKILGAKHGILGILGNDYIDLRKPSVAKLQAIAETPSSALGSCRKKPASTPTSAGMTSKPRMVNNAAFSGSVTMIGLKPISRSTLAKTAVPVGPSVSG